MISGAKGRPSLWRELQRWRTLDARDVLNWPQAAQRLALCVLLLALSVAGSSLVLWPQWQALQQLRAQVDRLHAQAKGAVAVRADLLRAQQELAQVRARMGLSDKGVSTDARTPHLVDQTLARLQALAQGHGVSLQSARVSSAQASGASARQHFELAGVADFEGWMHWMQALEGVTPIMWVSQAQVQAADAQGINIQMTLTLSAAWPKKQPEALP